MPNWCFNMLTVRGPEKKTDWFYDKFHKYGFEGFYPTPKELLEEPSPVKNEKKAKEFEEKYGAPDWYEWRIKNWGTKWNIDDDAFINLHKDLVEASFETAWSPPIEFFQKLHEDNPELEIELWFEEPGMGFFGLFKCKDGACTLDEYEWGERYRDGWWLYKQFVDLDSEFDALYEDVYDESIDEELRILSKYYDKIKEDDEKVRELFEVMSSRDVDEIKEFANKVKGELK